MLAPRLFSRPAPLRRVRLGAGLLILLALLSAGLLPAPAGAARPADAAAMPDIVRVPPGKGRVALTFDADAFVGRIGDILGTLRDYNARATFFLTGTYLDTYPSRVRAIAAAGQEIASHGYEHRDYRALSTAGIQRRLDSWQDTYYGLTGRYSPPFWRAPYGYSDDRVRQAAAADGYGTIYWTLDSLDTVGAPKSAAFIFARLTRPSITLDGAILLLHVNPNGTVDALPWVLDNLEARGLRVVSVSGLLAP